jgi:AAA+ ATPase superfamily predicted ATPase
MLFINRDLELQAINRDLSDNKLSITIVYGRRRIGKTWLLKKVMQEHPDSIYIFVMEGPPRMLIEIFREKISEKCSVSESRSWTGILEQLSDCLSNKKPFILIIDEFQRLGGDFASALQYYYDTNTNKPIKFILSGSSVSVVDRLVGSLGPLFGRSRIIRLGGFGFLESYIYLREKLGANVIDSFKIYSILGGSPYNLSLATTADWNRIASNEVHSIYGRLYEEPLYTLSSETREPGVYLGLLEAASGRGASYSKLASITGKTSLKRYIEVLSSLGILRKITPYGYDPRKTRNTWYYVSDPYWDYWLKEIYPRRMEAELTGKVPINEQKVEEHFSIWFERVARDLLTIIHGKPAVPWWRKDVEIDAVIKGDDGLKVYEIKYSIPDSRSLERIVRSLKIKAARIGEPIESIELITLKDDQEKNIIKTHTLEELVELSLKKKKIRIENIN